MKFIEAYNEMLKGKKIKRPSMRGYWYIDSYNGKITIDTKEGNDIIAFIDGDLTTTIINTLSEDWQVI